jgi:YHS domain-containing protein
MKASQNKTIASQNWTGKAKQNGYEYYFCHNKNNIEVFYKKIKCHSFRQKIFSKTRSLAKGIPPFSRKI